jgi:hypothetical protein
VSNTCIVHLTRVVIAFDLSESLGREALRDSGDVENWISSGQDVLKSLTLAKTSNHPRKDICRISSGYRQDIALRISSGYRSNRLQDIGI